MAKNQKGDYEPRVAMSRYERSRIASIASRSHHIAPTRRIAWRSALSGNTSLQGELITVIFAWDCSNHLTLLLMGLASGRDTEAGEFQRMHCEVIGCHLDFTWLYAFHGFTSRQDVRRLVLGAHFDLGTALIALGTARCHLEVIRLPRSLIPQSRGSVLSLRNMTHET